MSKAAKASMAGALIVAATHLLTPTALACTPPPDIGSYEWQRLRDAEHLAATTTVYFGVLENIVEHQNGFSVTFSVRKTDDVWGSPGPAMLDFEFTAGSCSWYLPFMNGWPDADAPAAGTEVAVFATPASLADTGQIYLVAGPEFEAYMAELRGLHSQ